YVGRGERNSIQTQFNTRYTAMKKILVLILLTCATAAPSQEQRTQQVWSGRLSDSMCGASHQMRAAGKMSERECLFECIKALAKYVLVDDKEQIIPIANQDLGIFLLYDARPVRITGEMKNTAILTRMEEMIPANV